MACPWLREEHSLSGLTLTPPYRFVFWGFLAKICGTDVSGEEKLQFYYIWLVGREGGIMSFLIIPHTLHMCLRNTYDIPHHVGLY